MLTLIICQRLWSTMMVRRQNPLVVHVRSIAMTSYDVGTIPPMFVAYQVQLLVKKHGKHQSPKRVGTGMNKGKLKVPRPENGVRRGLAAIIPIPLPPKLGIHWANLIIRMGTRVVQVAQKHPKRTLINIK